MAFAAWTVWFDGVQVRLEQVRLSPSSSWVLFERRSERFDFTWHFHPEYELTLITEGTGIRYVGDSIEPFLPGDLVLLGPNLPHTFASTATQACAEAVVAQFRSDFLGPAFFDVPNWTPIAALLDRSRRGLLFPAVESDLAAAVRGLVDRAEPARTIGLLDLLLRLVGLPAQPLAGTGYTRLPQESTRTRIDAVCRYLQLAYTRPVDLREVASVAHLSPAAFSRFFHQTMGRTLTAYLNEVRLDACCRLLAGTDLPITEIATRCGYQNLSYFNRCFLRANRVRPREYRARFRSGPVGRA